MSKFALLVGINYRGTSSELRGCIDDVTDIKAFLLASRGYKEENIVMLNDDTPVKPTQRNILRELASLVSKANAGASEVWFHYSGHGSYLPDQSRDEADGRDECIVPLDYRVNGMIIDDVLETYVERLPSTCRMICIMDCCHSGSILDLKYRYAGADRDVVENTECRCRANILMLSGCMDIQPSADAYINRRWSGALTQSFLHVMKELGNHASCDQLIDGVRTYLARNGYEQVPQICSSELVGGATPFL